VRTSAIGLDDAGCAAYRNRAFRFHIEPGAAAAPFRPRRKVRHHPL